MTSEINKPLINKKVLAKVIRESNICKHAIKESDGSIHYNVFKRRKQCQVFITLLLNLRIYFLS